MVTRFIATVSLEKTAIQIVGEGGENPGLKPCVCSLFVG